MFVFCRRFFLLFNHKLKKFKHFFFLFFSTTYFFLKIVELKCNIFFILIFFIINTITNIVNLFLNKKMISISN